MNQNQYCSQKIATAVRLFAGNGVAAGGGSVSTAVPCRNLTFVAACEVDLRKRNHLSPHLFEKSCRPFDAPADGAGECVSAAQDRNGFPGPRHRGVEELT